MYKDRNGDQQQHKGREGRNQLNKAADRGIHPTTEIAGQHTEEDADGGREQCGENRRAERNPRGVEQPGEGIAPQMVGAEQVETPIGSGAKRGEEACLKVQFVTLEGRDDGCEERKSE